MTKFLIQLLGGRAIAFNTGYLRLGISVNSALMLGQAVYWSERTSSPDGWFYKTQAEWLEEIGLTRYEQESSRKQLVKMGIFDEDLRGLPAKMHFRVNFERLAELAAQYVENQQTGLQENHKQACGNVASNDVGKPHTFSITKITHKTTAENTGNVSPALQGEKQPTKKRGAQGDKKSKAVVYSFDRWPSAPSDEVFERWLQHRKELGKRVTQGAIDGLGRHLHEAAKMLGWGVDRCLDYAREASWTGFNPKWVVNREGWGNHRPGGFNAPGGNMGGAGVRSTRDRPLSEDLTDRSWAQPGPSSGGLDRSWAEEGNTRTIAHDDFSQR